MKLCNFTARVTGELTKIHHVSPLTTNYGPYTDAHFSPPACQPLPLRNLSLNSSIFVLKLYQIDTAFSKSCALNFCKVSGVITNFSREMWWPSVSSPLNIVVKLYKFTALKKFQKDLWLFVGKFSVRRLINVSLLRWTKTTRSVFKRWIHVFSPLSLGGEFI